MDTWFVKGIFLLICTVVVAFICWVMLGFCLIVYSENYCIERGWGEGIVSFSLKQFCKSRINQTDVIVPLKRAENRILN